MNRNDIDEAMRNIDPDIVKETSGKRMTKKKWIGLAVSCACFVLCVAVLSTWLIVGNLNKTPSNLDGVIGGKENTSALDKFIDGIVGSKGDSKEILSEAEMPVPMPGADAAYYGAIDRVGEIVDTGVIGGIVDISAKAGTLTAGEWRDTDDLSAWFKLINDNNWYAYAKERALFSNKAVTVCVKDGDNPCFNVKVALKNGNTVVAEGRTNINGFAYLFYDLKNEKLERPATVSVDGKDYELNADSIEIEAKDAGITLSEIDLMYMIDTTGSMGDELEYIKAELVDMVERIAAKDEAVSIRVSVNFYRDEGDEYIVKYYDFRTDINQCLDQIKQESATGGGDFPEAVHTALDNVVSGHQWRNNALKLCFFVLDAPPHSESEISGINDNIRESLIKAAVEGIRIIPVFCSGADQASEYLFRSFAAITNGTFVFLTDDSGIGGSHEEVTVGDYSVEKLNDCMVRIVCEFAGFEYEKPVQEQQQQ